jgi:hypothetical protein
VVHEQNFLTRTGTPSSIDRNSGVTSVQPLVLLQVSSKQTHAQIKGPKFQGFFLLFVPVIERGWDDILEHF